MNGVVAVVGEARPPLVGKQIEIVERGRRSRAGGKTRCLIASGGRGAPELPVTAPFEELERAVDGLDPERAPRVRERNPKPAPSAPGPRPPGKGVGATPAPPPS